MSDLPHVQLNDGKAMPQIGLGVWRMPSGDTEGLVASAIDLGYRAVDTATMYGNEAEVGAAVRATGEPVFVTTKLLNQEQGYDAALRAFDASMERLGLDWLDLYLIHWPAPARNQQVETWKALVHLREAGRVRSIGVSNFRIVDLERIIDATGVVPAVNQFECHPRFQQTELRAFHDENGIATTCWAPLGRDGSLGHPTITRIADKLGRTPAQVILRWHLENGLIVIPKASSAARQAENLDIVDWSLDADDMAGIARMDDAGGRYGPDPANLN